MKIRLLVLASLFISFLGVAALQTGCGSGSPASPSNNSTPFTTPVLFIYSTDTSGAATFQSLLNAHGYSATTVTVSGASSANLSNYSVIILDSDTGSTVPWSGSTTLPNAILASGKPVLGMGAGGAVYFDTEGYTGIGFGASAYNGENGILNVVDATNTIWSNPNAIATGAPVTTYTPGSGTQELYYTSAPGGGTTLIGGTNGHTGYYAVASQTKTGLTYLFWGQDSAPTAMTTVGQNLFINCMKFL
jgi:hypothetical protein